jgi:hypothetical protein
VTALPGGCHCGNLATVFETRQAPQDLWLRSCACSFCAAHGARNVSDPEGSVRIVVRDPDDLVRYRFGLRTADFLVCRRCGIYIGAMMSEGGAAWFTSNVNALRDRAAFTQAVSIVDFEHETEPERRARRRAKWTPVVEFRTGTAERS